MVPGLSVSASVELELMVHRLRLVILGMEADGYQVNELREALELIQDVRRDFQED